MSSKIRRRRRCVLSVPGINERMIKRGLSSGVDQVFLDLEDSVVPEKKPDARELVIHAFNDMDWNGTVRCFRMNGLDTAYAYDDLINVVEAAGSNIDTIVIPKVKYARDVHFVESLLEMIELKVGLKTKIGLEILIEEVEGIANIKEISLASNRIESLMFGIGDYTRSQGVPFSDAFGPTENYPGDLWHFQRSTLAVAARVAGCDYVDGPWALIPDLDGYARECRMVKSLGSVGKWALHPSQIPIATQEFSPSNKQIKQAVLYIGLFSEARKKGLGAISADDGTLLDEAVLPLFEQVLENARFFGIDIPKYESQNTG